jgi:hypothetical protein
MADPTEPVALEWRPRRPGWMFISRWIGARPETVQEVVEDQALTERPLLLEVLRAAEAFTLTARGRWGSAQRRLWHNNRRLLAAATLTYRSRVAPSFDPTRPPDQALLDLQTGLVTVIDQQIALARTAEPFAHATRMATNVGLRGGDLAALGGFLRSHSPAWALRVHHANLGRLAAHHPPLVDTSPARAGLCIYCGRPWQCVAHRLLLMELSRIYDVPHPHD